MAAQWLFCTTTIAGQSQAIMFAGAGETAEPGLTVTGQARLVERLAASMPGVTVAVRSKSNGGSPPTYSCASGTPLFRWLGDDAGWWNLATAAYDTHGGPLRDYILEAANAQALHVLVHYCNTQDDAAAGFSFASYRDGLAAYYQTLFDDCAPAFGAFRILPVVNASRGSGNNNLGSIRRIVDAIAGYGPPVSGLSRLPFVLRPVYPMGWLPIAAYQQGSGDAQHVMRSTARRAAEAITVRIAGANGVVPPEIDQPRLCRAVMVAPGTCRAFIVSPQRRPIRQQGPHGFALAGAGSIASVAPIENGLVAATGYATVDLSVSGITALSRLTHYANYAGQSFANGTTAPRGLMQNVMFADPTPGLTITDAYEDLLLDGPVLLIAQNQAGVPVEI
jgi:hypothetical protein